MLGLSDSMLGNDDFLRSLGVYHGIWTSLDATIDYAISKFLKLSHTEAHILTSGMMYGAKIRLLKEVAKRSDHPKKSDIVYALKKIQGAAKRNEITHSHIVTGKNTVMFISRSGGREFTATKLEFTMDAWARHLYDFTDHCKKLHDALGYTAKELDDFVKAALNIK